ncbi:MAG: DUF4857 domain-containing protein [Candidatus Neomarinimicrobiota bacterium]
MLNKISRYTIILLIVVVSALYLPDFFSMLFDKKVTTPRMDYSVIINDFVYTRNHGMGQRDRMDIKGNSYEEREYFRLLPFMYYANLDKWGQLPEEIEGIEISSKIIRKNSQVIRIAPKYVNPPLVPLNIMFEAEGDYAELIIPDDVFRLGNTIEFLDPTSNSVLQEKSKKFQDAMKKIGFKFPVKLSAANQTNRKPFDEGYFIVDANNELFHLKMIKGEPAIINTGIGPDLQIRQIYVSENTRKEFYGFILSEDNQVYLITYDDYKLRHIPTASDVEGQSYVADKMTVRFYTYPVNKHIQVIGDGFNHMIVLDNDFNKKAEHTMEWTPYAKRPASIAKSYLFPFELDTYDPLQYVKVSLSTNLPQALVGIALSLIALFIFSRKRPILDYVIVLFTGVFGLIGVLLIKPEE